MAAAVRGATVYISDPSDVIVLNFTATALSPAALELARLACQANTICANLAVQNDGNYIGMQQWAFLNIHRPPWTPYPYVEQGAFAVLDGKSINDIYPVLNVYATVLANAVLPACEIGTTPLWDTATGNMLCTPQVDAAMSSTFYSRLWTWIAYGAVGVAVLLCIFYFSYIPDGWLNLKWNGELVITGYTPMVPQS